MAGDDILKSFAYKLNSMFNEKQNSIVSRLSGDEFAIFFTKKPSIQKFIEIAQKLVSDVEKMPFFYEHNELSIRVSVGGSYQMKIF